MLALLALFACTGELGDAGPGVEGRTSSSPKPQPVVPPSDPAADGPLPPYLAQPPGLFVREGDRVVEAPAGDVTVARTYPRSKDKGPLVDGHRLTLVTAKRSYHVGEEVRVIHVHEVEAEGDLVFPMGSKPVRGERIDGTLVTAAALVDADPFRPDLYDSEVRPHRRSTTIGRSPRTGSVRPERGPSGGRSENSPRTRSCWRLARERNSSATHCFASSAVHGRAGAADIHLARLLQHTFGAGRSPQSQSYW